MNVQNVDLSEDIVLALGSKDLEIIRLKAIINQLQAALDEADERLPAVPEQHVTHLREVPREERTDLLAEPMVEQT